MVMHARKPQRMNDGYFEKHQTHPYQNSKYSSSKGNYGSSSERYERIRDSPNGNSFRSESPDSQSPRDRERGYQSKGSYLQKIREKERENRDYKMSRDKYSDCARSPKDKRSRESRDSEHRTNHDRSSDDKLLLKMTSQNSSRDRKLMHNCQEKQREDRERLTRVGDWSEHISSSGKKYYYNCKTEVSQWEKPREWIEREQRDRDRFRGSSSSSNKDRNNDISDGRGYSGSSRSSTVASSGGHDKHSNSSRSLKRHWRDDTIDTGGTGGHDPRRKHIILDGDMQSTQLALQDMDISPGDSTPTSEISYVHTPAISSRDLSHNSTTTTLTTTTITSDHVQPILLATALPRLQPQPQSHHHQQPPSASPSIADITSTPSMVPPPAGSIITSNTPGPPVVTTLSSLPRIMSQSQSKDPSLSGGDKSNLSLIMADSGSVNDGPPTPTHSENHDCLDPRKALLVASANSIQSSMVMNSPPILGNNSISSGSATASTSTGATSSLSSLQQHVGSCTSSLSALRPQGPSITPSLANYYRDDLVNHVRGWPADILEKQAQKLSDEAHIMGSLQCSKVSADLKSARSVVRLTEIQATLQEQRILFLRQQIKTLEDMKSQNSFMSDDS